MGQLGGWPVMTLFALCRGGAGGDAVMTGHHRIQMAGQLANVIGPIWSPWWWSPLAGGWWRRPKTAPSTPPHTIF